MECGFYNPQKGYWQTLVTPTPEEVLAYQKGTIEVPLKPSPNHEWKDEVWLFIPPPEPTPEELRAQMAPLTKWRFDTIIDSREGLRDKIETMIDRHITDPLMRFMARNKFRSVPEFHRMDSLFPLLSSASEINISDEDIDLMWQQGLALPSL